MFVLIRHVHQIYSVLTEYLKVDNDFATKVSWTADLKEAKIFDSETSAELFAVNNERFLNECFDCDNIFIAELQPQIKSYIGTFGKNQPNNS